MLFGCVFEFVLCVLIRFYMSLMRFICASFVLFVFNSFYVFFNACVYVFNAFLCFTSPLWPMCPPAGLFLGKTGVPRFLEAPLFIF